MPVSKIDLEELILNYDPLEPNPKFFATATEVMLALAAPVLPEPVPWPSGSAPIAMPPANAPAATDPLPEVDVLVVTWTAAEARALAALFTDGAQLEQWFEYDHNLAAFIPKVTGPKAPFNDPKLARYYHHLGLYYPCKVGQTRVLCLKSGLHFAYDGPDVPVADLWNQILDETKAKLVITTGTGGGIGANVKLGDVIIAANVVFDCTTKFKNEPFAHESYKTSNLPNDPVSSLSEAMLKPNANQLPGGGIPVFLYPGGQNVSSPRIVTTDFFAYDDTNDSNGLQELGNVCEMGDAVLGKVMKARPNPPNWVAIRNASDPQMDGSLPKAERDKQAAQIYQQYGIFTTAGSLLATWGVIRALFPEQFPLMADSSLAEAKLTKSPATASIRARKRPDAAQLLLEIAAADDFRSADTSAPNVPPETVAALKTILSSINVPYESSDIDYRQMSFTDEWKTAHTLYLAHVSNDDAESFRGSYLFEESSLIAKQEFASS